ncbi:MAG: glycoside hydrolase family 5 protein [Fimbriimonadaceae bacterium]
MIAIIACAWILMASPPSAAARGLPQLHTAGNQILDDHDRRVILRGVNVASMEWSSTGEGHLMNTLRVAVTEWHANIIRLPMSQDRWFGKGPEQTDGGRAYRGMIRSAVNYCASNRCYILLDLHWNDAGQWGKNIGQHVMPDMYSLEFWKSCAHDYRNQSAVLFDLYNEPHDTTWDIWLNGGDIDEQRGPGARQGRFVPVKYRTPGMQEMLDTVRSTGARNVVVCGGLDWAYDLSGFLKGYRLKDPKGHGVIYACHTYPIKGDSVDAWLKKLDAALPSIPVIMSEFGANNRGASANQPNPWVARVVAAMETRHCNWIAWDMHPAAGPTLVSDWQYTPTPSFGVIVKAALAHRS